MPMVPANEFKAALASLKRARNLLMLAILLVLIFQVGVFFCIDKCGLLDEKKSQVQCDKVATSQPVSDKTPASQPACDVTKSCAISVESRRLMLNWMLPASRYLAFFASIMLCVVLGIGAHFSMLGPGARGIHQMISSFMWAVILLLLLTPWQKIMPASGLASATFSLGDIYVLRAKFSECKFGYLTYYARFVAYPVLAFLVWCLIASKFSRACRKLTASTAAKVTE